MEFLGRVDDNFVFTHNNDVITWSREDRLQKVETGYDHLDDAAIWNDAVLIVGDGDSIAYIDDGVLHPLWDGLVTGADTPAHIDLPYEGVAWVHTADSNIISIDPDWTFYV